MLKKVDLRRSARNENKPRCLQALQFNPPSPSILILNLPLIIQVRYSSQPHHHHYPHLIQVQHINREGPIDRSRFPFQPLTLSLNFNPTLRSTTLLRSLSIHTNNHLNRIIITLKTHSVGKKTIVKRNVQSSTPIITPHILASRIHPSPIHIILIAPIVLILAIINHLVNLRLQVLLPLVIRSRCNLTFNPSPLKKNYDFDLVFFSVIILLSS